ncbi:MAG: PAS domain S-box protein, partial [Oceanidesulfovibrio sp.]
MIPEHKDEHLRFLEDRIKLLIMEKDLAMSALGTAVAMSGLHGVDTAPQAFLDRVLDELETVMPSVVSGIYTVDEETADFILQAVRPEAEQDRLADEVEAIIEDRTFSYALLRNTPVVISTKDRSAHIVLQSLATASRIRGMYVAILWGNRDVVTDTGLALLPVLLNSTANTMESHETNRYIKSVNTTLQATIERLEASERELLVHRERLAAEVTERTSELTRANELLVAEVAERRKAQEELALERDYIATLLDTSGALILVLDESLTVVRCNNTCRNHFCNRGAGCAEGPFLDRFLDIHRETVRDNLAAVLNSSQVQSPIFFEAAITDVNGLERTISWTCSRLPGPADTPPQVIVSGIDISEKISIERALRDSEARFRAIFMSAGLGIVLGDRTGSFIDANPAFCAMMGYSREEIAALHINDLSLSEDRDGRAEEYLRLLEGGQSQMTAEKRYVRKDGSVFWGRTTLTCVGSPTDGPRYLIGMIANISEQKELEEALRSAEATYRNIFENAVEGIFLAKPDGPYLKVNPAMAHMFGYPTPERFLEGVPTALEHLFPESEVRDECFGRLRDKGQIISCESRTVRLEGDDIWISINARALHDEHGNILSIEGLAEDITERKAREQHLKRLATIDELTGIPNRHLFLNRFDQLIAQSARMDHTLALLYIDLDDFKDVNDNHGHHTGDVVLAEAAGRLRNRVRKSDTLARLGGDEFCILLVNPARPQDINGVAEQIIQTLSTPYRVDDRECRIGAS